jgi:hypothetical protein
MKPAQHTTRPAESASREEHGADQTLVAKFLGNGVHRPGAPYNPPSASERVTQLSNGPILHVSFPMDIRVSPRHRGKYHPVRLLTVAVCFSPKRRK